MKCSVFIATSADGFIARKDGNIDWLHSSGNQNIDMQGNEDMGFANYISTVDCMIMGRKTMEKISSFNLAPDEWPYGDIKIYVLSKTVVRAPENLRGKIEMYAGDINSLISDLAGKGYQNAYIDGGTTIQSLLKLQLINEFTITRAPVLLGDGIPLFTNLENDIALEQAHVTSFPNDFIQVHYRVKY